jgi:hypothetical protein
MPIRTTGGHKIYRIRGLATSGFGPRTGPASGRREDLSIIEYPYPALPPPEPEPDAAFLVLPLTYDEQDHLGEMTWTRQGGSSHVTPDGFEGNGWNSRLKSTTIPGWMAGASGALGLQASVKIYDQQPMNASGDTVIHLGADAAGVTPNSKLALRVLRNPNTSTRPYLALQAYTNALQTLALARPHWTYEGRYPEMSRSGNSALPQAITFVGTGSDILVSAHYEDTESRMFLIDRTTRQVRGTFQFPLHTHLGTATVDRSGSLWVTDSSVEHLMRVDLAASLASGTGSIDIDYSLSALSAAGGVEFINAFGVEYMLCAEYATAGTPYIYVIPYSLISSGSSFATASRFKRFQIGLRCQGLTIRSGSLWAAKNVSGGTTAGFIERYDNFADTIVSGADGSALTADYTLLGASEYVEDLATDPLTGLIWMNTEGWNAVDDFDGWKGMWSTPGDGEPVENHVTLHTAGTGSVSIKMNDHLFQSVTWTPTPAVAVVSIGGPPNTAAEFTSGFFSGYVRNIRLQNGAISASQYQDTIGGTYETGSLTVYSLTLTNPGAESTTTGWTNVSGTLGNRAANPTPYSGSSYFFGGASALLYAHQRVDMWTAAGLTGSDFASGGIWAKLRWAQASFDTQDPATAGIRILSSSGGAFMSLTTGSRDWIPNGNSGVPPNWHQLALGVDVPAGARLIDAVMHASRSAGTNLDGYWDNLSLTLYRR